MVDTPAVEEPFRPTSATSIPPTRRPGSAIPRQLARLFTTEMWERFGYYGMRALLTLYLTKHFLFGDQQATGLYGGYTALVYLTPLVGGLLADQYLGSKRSVKFGAIVMALGYFMLVLRRRRRPSPTRRSTASATKCQSTISSIGRRAIQ